jgi:hypothetical protein
MTNTRQNYRAKSDVLFSKLVRERDGGCVAAGYRFDCKGYLQCAHVIPRRYNAIRTDFDNAIALCSSHHVYWTYRPLEWREFVDVRFPGRWDELRVRALSDVKVDWKHRYRTLAEMRDALGVS